MSKKIAGDAKLMTRTAREALKPNRKPYYRMVARGVALGYRKPLKGAGAWVLRKFVGGNDYTVKNLAAVADDYEEANGVNVLSFAQALAFVTSEKNQSANAAPYTVARACADYVAFLQSEGRNAAAIRDAETRINAFVLPSLGDCEIADLKPEQLRKWRTDLTKAGPRLRTRSGEKQKHRSDASDRARKASANRHWTCLRAALNHAFREGKAASDAAWRRVKPFNNVDAARVRYLTIEESRRLVNGCDAEFRLRVQAALQTGARYGQIDANATGS
jgi:hypothetical protein